MVAAEDSLLLQLSLQGGGCPRVVSDGISYFGLGPVWRLHPYAVPRCCDVPISQNLPLKGAGHSQVNFDLILCRMQTPPFLQGFGLHGEDAVNEENTEQPRHCAECHTASHMPDGNRGELPLSLLALSSYELLKNTYQQTGYQ